MRGPSHPGSAVPVIAERLGDGTANAVAARAIPRVGSGPRRGRALYSARCTRMEQSDERRRAPSKSSTRTGVARSCCSATTPPTIVPPAVNGGDLGLPRRGHGAPHRLRHRRARGDRGARAAARRAGDPHALLAAGDRPEPRRGRPDAGDAALRRHDHPGEPRRRRRARSRGGWRPTIGPTTRAINAAIDAMAAAGRDAGAGRDPFLHAAAPRAGRRGRGRSASSGTATAGIALPLMARLRATRACASATTSPTRASSRATP